MGLFRSARKSASARAQLAEFHDSFKGAVNPGGSGTAHHTSFQMRVTPEDGKPQFESQMSVWGGDADRLQAGRWTYVCFDPGKPERCELDKDRFATEFELLYDGKHRVMVLEEASSTWSENAAPVDARAWSEHAPEPDPRVGDLSRLADLRASGTLSDAEFAAAKARLLNQANPGWGRKLAPRIAL